MGQLSVWFCAHDTTGVANHVSDWSAPNFRRIQFVVLDPTVVRDDQAFGHDLLLLAFAPPLPFCLSHQQANKAIIIASTKGPAYAHKNLQPTLHSLGQFLGKRLNFREFKTQIQAGTEPIPAFSIPFLNPLIAQFHTRTSSKQFAKTNTTTIPFCIRVTRSLQFSFCLFFVFYLHYLHQVLQSRRNKFFLPKGKHPILGL